MNETVSRQVRWGKKRGMGLGLIGLGLLLLGAVTLMRTPSRASVTRPVVTVDIRAISHDFARRLIQQHRSIPAQRAASQQFAAALRATCQAYAARHHVILLRADSVLAGSPSVTPAIQAALAVRLAHTGRPA